MRLLYIAADPRLQLGANNGAARRTRALLASLKRAGHEVELLTGPVPRLPDLPDVAVRVIHASQSALRRAGPAPERVLDRVLEQTLPRVLQRFDAQGVMERASLFGLAAARTCRRLAIPHVLDLLAPLAQERQLRGHLDAHPRWKRAETRVINAAEHIVVPAPEVAHWLETHHARPSTVLPGGVDPDEFDPARFVRTEAGLLRVGVYAASGPWQGVEGLIPLLLQARERGLDLELQVLGKGASAQVLKRQVQSTALAQRTRFLSTPREKVPRVLASWDLGIVPAIPDTLRPPSLALYEMMAMELPVLAPDTESFRRALGEGTDAAGIRVGPDPPTGLDALLRLGADARLRKSMGKTGRKRVLANYPWGGIAQGLMDALELARDSRS